MSRFRLGPAGLILVAVMVLGSSTCAYSQNVWTVPSPNHEQTFAYGSEQNRVWTTRGSDQHLAVLLNFTNDPFVDRSNPREYDNFIFHFPAVRLGSDGRTFYYHAPDGHSIPVAERRPDFFGITEVKLLPTSYLAVNKPHGYLSKDRRPRVI